MALRAIGYRRQGRRSPAAIRPYPAWADADRSEKRQVLLTPHTWWRWPRKSGRQHSRASVPAQRHDRRHTNARLSFCRCSRRRPTQAKASQQTHRSPQIRFVPKSERTSHTPSLYRTLVRRSWLLSHEMPPTVTRTIFILVRVPCGFRPHRNLARINPAFSRSASLSTPAG